MALYPVPLSRRAVILLAGVGWLAGCATPIDDSRKIVINGDEYITLEAPVGSHMKRRVRITEVKEPGVSPTRKDIVTADTDTTILPPTAGEMERMISDRPTGGP
jgi:hypothetical protein